VRDTGPSTAARDNCVIYSRLEPPAVDAAIEAQIAHFEQLGREFEWKVHSHDLPHDLKERLARRGFETEDEEALVVLDLEEVTLTALPPDGVEIRRLTDPAALDDMMAVRDRVRGSDETGLRNALAEEMRADPAGLSVYVAYEGNQPICCAWARFPTGTQFASLWGGTTIPEQRGRGVYRAIVAARAEEARRRGARFLTVDAGPMSRPILERLGFRCLTMMIACIWRIRSRDG
jgi:GNAT superfamily N-acetyltransferase